MRFADRDQKVRYSTYNWAPIAPSWGCNGGAWNVDTTTPTPYPTDGAGNPIAGCPTGTFQGYPEGIWEATSLNSHYNSHVFPNGPLVFLSRDTLRNYGLQTEGLAEGQPGKGVYVVREPTPNPPSAEFAEITQRIESLRDALAAAMAQLDARVSELEKSIRG